MESNEEGTVALPVDSLLAVAGGVLGGIITASTLWLTVWRVLERRHGPKRPGD